MWVRGVAVVMGLAFGLVPAAHADFFCKSKKGSVKVRAACKSKETQLDLAAFGAAGPPGANGTNGTNGTNGADGQLRIYGDGSAGVKAIAADTVWTGVDAPTNLQFTDVTINAGTTLTVPSGTVIRCTGTFANNGMIVVSTAAAGAFVSSSAFLGSSFGPETTPGEAGISLRAAQSGEIGDASAFRNAGIGGAGLSAEQARTILHPGIKAGGGGGAGGSDSFLSGQNDGQAGGGSLVVLCQGTIIHNGTITADGAGPTSFSFGGPPIFFGGGGGGGGVVVLASKTSVTIGPAGVINARGGPGQDSDGNEGASGGGGGGIVHLLAPAVNNSGTLVVTGGGAGVAGAAASVAASPRAGGGGGGASGGNGGEGGGVSTGGDPAAAAAGGDGFALTTVADPAALF
jgi:hypothetical protein